MAGLNNEDLQRQVLLQQLGKKTNHLLHFFLSIFTLGLWIPVWLLIGLSNKLESDKMRDLASSGRVSSSTRLKQIIGIAIALFLFAPVLLTVISIFSHYGPR